MIFVKLAGALRSRALCSANTLLVSASISKKDDACKFGGDSKGIELAAKAELETRAKNTRTGPSRGITNSFRGNVNISVRALARAIQCLGRLTMPATY